MEIIVCCIIILGRFMHAITLTDHPVATAVFNAPARVEEAAAQTRALILRPEFNSVVILRDPRTLPDTAATVCRAFSDGERVGNMDHYDIVGQTLYKATHDYRSVQECPADTFKDKYGPDFGYMKDFAGCFAVAALQVRRKSPVIGSHLDGAMPLQRFRANHELRVDPYTLLPYGVTATLSARGGGTHIVEAERGEFCRKICADGREGWEYRPSPGAAHEEWCVPEGAILVIRTVPWDAERLPSVHKTPDPVGENAGENRIIAVARMAGMM
jgi:hypothetical protein